MQSSKCSKMIKNLNKNLNITIFFSILGLISGLIFSNTILKPIYSSTAQFSIQNCKVQSNQKTELLNIGNDINSNISIQSQILKSRKLAYKVWQDVQAKYHLKQDDSTGSLMVKNSIQVKTIPNSSIIELKSFWNNPKIANDIVRKYLSNYSEINALAAKNEIIHNQILGDKKLAIANTNLMLVQEKINQLKNAGSYTKAKEETEKELSWIKIISTLKSRQSEILLNNFDNLNNISMIDFPAVEKKPIFPDKNAVTLIFTAIFGIFGIISAMTKPDDLIEDLNEVEKFLNTTILGVIPWLSKDIYKDQNSVSLNNEIPSYYSIAYQKTISSIKIRGRNTKANTFVFSSSEFTKYRSTLLMNTALGLAKTGQSVILIDADFRTPSLHSELGYLPNNQYNLANLLLTINTEINNKTLNWNFLSYFIQKLPESDKLSIITNNDNLAEPQEFLNSNAFCELIEKLKTIYDWILIDTPPILAVPDTISASVHCDGLILVTGLKTNRNHLNEIKKTISRYQIPLFGIIGREEQKFEAIAQNSYIKQIISSMINQT